MSTRSLCRAVAGALIVVCLSPAAARAQDEAFKDGLRALKKESWAEAAAALRSAADADGRESDRTVRAGAVLGIFGGIEQPYLPYYFLGDALFALGDCAGAVTAWSESERQQVVSGERLARLREHYTICETRGVLGPSAYDELLARTRADYAEARARFTRASNLAAGNRHLLRAPVDEDLDAARRALEEADAGLDTAVRSRREADFIASAAAAARSSEASGRAEAVVQAALDARATVQRLSTELERTVAAAADADAEIERSGVSLAGAMLASRNAARARLAQARTKADAGGREGNAGMLKEAIGHAQFASAALRTLQAEVAALARQQAERRRTAAIESAERAIDSIAPSLARLDGRAAELGIPLPADAQDARATIERQVARLRGRLEGARKAGNEAVLDEIARLAGEAVAELDALAARLALPTLSARGVPEWLERGAGLFMAGQYNQALAAMAGTAESPGVADAIRAHAYLFRAAAHYAIYALSADAGQLRSALTDIGTCKALNPALSPDPRVFSAPFLMLFRHVRPSP